MRERGRKRSDAAVRQFVYYVSYALTSERPLTYVGHYHRPNRSWRVELRESEFKQGHWVFEIAPDNSPSMISEYDYKTRNSAAAGAWREMHAWDTELDFEAKA